VDLTTIGNNVFQNCASLEQVSLPAGLTTIGNNAFAGCVFLEEVSLPAGLTTIGNYVFDGCTALRWVKWPVSAANAVLGTTTSGGAFRGCTRLEKVELPDNLTAIRAYAFSGSSSLRVVILRGATPPTMSANAFTTTVAGLQFYVPDAAVSTYQAATTWSTANYKSKIVSINTLATADDPSNW
jgi:hypothetical protein